MNITTILPGSGCRGRHSSPRRAQETVRACSPPTSMCTWRFHDFILSHISPATIAILPRHIDRKWSPRWNSSSEWETTWHPENIRSGKIPHDAGDNAIVFWFLWLLVLCRKLNAGHLTPDEIAILCTHIVRCEREQKFMIIYIIFSNIFLSDLIEFSSRCRWYMALICPHYTTSPQKMRKVAKNQKICSVTGPAQNL